MPSLARAFWLAYCVLFSLRNNVATVDSLSSERRMTSDNEASEIQFDFGLPKPVQLLKPDVMRQTLIVEENGAKLLRKIPSPISIVSVVGSVHSGKSFFMNQLLGRFRGFDVGYNIDAQTAGIWMWSEPIKVNGVNVILLDCEGFYAANRTEIYDAKVFSLATLLSTEVIYNTVKFIDNQSVDFLETIAKRAKLFALRAHARETDVPSNKRFTESDTCDPDVDELCFNNDASVEQLVGHLLDSLMPYELTWVVQDFVQDLKGMTPIQWLNNLLEPPRTVKQEWSFYSSEDVDSTDSKTDSGAQTTSPGAILRSFFRNIECLTLPPPTGDISLLQKLDMASMDSLDEEYISTLSRYRKNMLDKVSQHPKSIPKDDVADKRQMLSGRDIEALMRFLVDASDASSVDSDSAEIFPQIPSLWDTFASLQLQFTINDLTRIFIKTLTSEVLNANPPLLELQVTERITATHNHIMQLWRQSSIGIQKLETVKSLEMELKSKVDEAHKEAYRLACTRISELCRNETALLGKDVKDDIRDQEFHIPQNPETLANHSTNRLAAAEQKLKDRLNKKRDDSFGNDKLVNSSSSGEDHKLNYWTSKCCSPLIDEYLALNRELWRALLSKNQFQIDERLSKAYEEARRHLYKSLHLDNVSNAPHVQFFKVPLETLNSKLAKAEDEALQIYENKIGSLTSIHKAEQLRRNLKSEIEKAEIAAKAKWDSVCRGLIKELMTRLSSRLPINIRKKIPFPTTEEVLYSALIEQMESARDSFSEIHCSGSAIWTEAKVELDSHLNDEATKLDAQNVQTIKDLSEVPLSEALNRLERLSRSYYYWRRFESVAKSSAASALRDAAKTQGISLNSKLEAKVVCSFLHKDLRKLLRRVSSNCFQAVVYFIILGITICSICHRLYRMAFIELFAMTAVLGLLVWDNVIRQWASTLLYYTFVLMYDLVNISDDKIGLKPKLSVMDHTSLSTVVGSVYDGNNGNSANISCYASDNSFDIRQYIPSIKWIFCLITTYSLIAASYAFLIGLNKHSWSKRRAKENKTGEANNPANNYNVYSDNNYNPPTAQMPYSSTTNYNKRISEPPWQQRISTEQNSFYQSRKSTAEPDMSRRRF